MLGLVDEYECPASPWLPSGEYGVGLYSHLPASAIYIEIGGANHAYFGGYGAQSGDGEPTIPREKARAEVAGASSDLVWQRPSDRAPKPCSNGFSRP